MAADTFDARPINVLRSSLAGLSSAWVLFLARISQEIIFNPQASAQVQRYHPGFLFRFLQCGAAAFGRTPKAAWSSGSLWPNRPGDHSTRKRTWWARPFGDFQGRINPRLIQTDALPACVRTGGSHLPSGKPCPVSSGLSHSTHCVREVLEVMSLRNTRLKSRQITPLV